MTTPPSPVPNSSANPLPRGQSRPSRLRALIWAPLAPALMFLFQSIPVRLLEPLATLVARFWSRAPRERHILGRNLHRILGIDIESPEGERMARNIYRNQVICAMEAIRAIHRPELVKVEGLWAMRTVFQEAEAKGRGTLLVTAHLGSWEMIEIFVPPCLENRFYELAKPSRVRAFTKLLEKLRLEAGTHVIWNNHRMLLRKMIRVLREGHTLGLACDQKPRQLLGPVVDFFGRETEFVGGPGAVAAKTGCAVIAVFCTRLGPFTYRVRTEELYSASDERRDADEITQRIAHTIEGAVRACPEQWPWTYRRWIYEDDEWQGPRGRDRPSSEESSSERRSDRAAASELA